MAKLTRLPGKNQHYSHFPPGGQNREYSQPPWRGGNQSQSRFDPKRPFSGSRQVSFRPNQWEDHPSRYNGDYDRSQPRFPFPQGRRARNSNSQNSSDEEDNNSTHTSQRENNHTNGESDQPSLSSKELAAIKRLLANLDKEEKLEKKKADILSLTSLTTNTERLLHDVPSSQTSTSEEEESSLSPLEREHAAPRSPTSKSQTKADKASPDEDSAIPDGEPLVQQFLADLIEKGVAHKFHLSTILENKLEQEALLDPAADVTLLSSALFKKLQSMAGLSKQNLKLQRCSLDVQSYSATRTTLPSMALIHFTLGPMSLVHPVYVSPLDYNPSTNR